jgi:hypothetical protein
METCSSEKLVYNKNTDYFNLEDGGSMFFPNTDRPKSTRRKNPEDYKSTPTAVKTSNFTTSNPTSL